MYLPIETVREILTSCGYEGYEKIYLSSEIGLRKKTGSLFKHFIIDSGITPKNHIHIGDALRSDYLRALLSGLHALKIPRKPKRSRYTKTRGLKTECREQYAKYQSVICNMTDPDANEYYQYGFEVVGMALYGMCCWLHERFTERKHDKVFFIARDGYIMREAYNLLFGEKAVNNSYLYISRKSLRIPQIWMNNTLEAIFGTGTQYRRWNYEQICSWLNIDYSLGLEVWRSCGLSEDEELLAGQIISDKRTQKFFEHFKNNLAAESRREFDKVLDYLRQEGFSSSVGIVDIGWVGHIQNYLRQYVFHSDLNADINGYYFGLIRKDITGDKAESFVPQEMQPSYFCSLLLEYPITKQEGSVKGYVRNESDIVLPVLDDYEFSGSDDEKIIGYIQKGALDFIAVMKDGYGYEHADYSVGYAKLRQVTKFPTLKQANLFGGLSYTNENRTLKMSAPSGILHYTINPREFMNDFSSCGWVDGFLKRLLKIPFPYDKFLSLIRKVMERKHK